MYAQFFLESALRSSGSLFSPLLASRRFPQKRGLVAGVKRVSGRTWFLWSCLLPGESAAKSVDVG